LPKEFLFFRPLFVQPLFSPYPGRALKGVATRTVLPGAVIVLALRIVLHSEPGLCVAGVFRPHLAENTMAKMLGVEVFCRFRPALPAHPRKETPHDDQPVQGIHLVCDRVEGVVTARALILIVARATVRRTGVELNGGDKHAVLVPQDQSVEHALIQAARQDIQSVVAAEYGVPNDRVEIGSTGSR